MLMMIPAMNVIIACILIKIYLNLFHYCLQYPHRHQYHSHFADYHHTELRFLSTALGFCAAMGKAGAIVWVLGFAFLKDTPTANAGLQACSFQPSLSPPHRPGSRATHTHTLLPYYMWP
jgi:hypothetical protein